MTGVGTPIALHVRVRLELSVTSKLCGDIINEGAAWGKERIQRNFFQ